MSGPDYKCTVVYSVCGHTMLERPSQLIDRTQLEVSRYISFDMARNVLPKSFECKAGWCPMCSDFYQTDNIDDNTTAINNYWRFKTQKRWAHSVYPGQVPRSVLSSHPAGILARSAVVDMAACLDSLFGQVHGNQSEEMLFLHKCGPVYIEAANLIRRTTLRWAKRMDYLNKPLPACPQPAEQEESQMLTNSTYEDTCKRGEKKTKPTPLFGLAQSKRISTFIDDKGDRYWVPGAHRTPTGKPQSAPVRMSKALARCHHHGRVNASSVDMTCGRCKAIFLDESQVSPGSKLVTHHSAPAFSTQFYAYAAEGKCSCVMSKHEVCSPCMARAQLSEHEGLGYGFL